MMAGSNFRIENPKNVCEDLYLCNPYKIAITAQREILLQILIFKIVRTLHHKLSLVCTVPYYYY